MADRVRVHVDTAFISAWIIHSGADIRPWLVESLRELARTGTDRGDHGFTDGVGDLRRTRLVCSACCGKDALADTGRCDGHKGDQGQRAMKGKVVHRR